MRAKKLNGFSLMEMMVVLLIVAIIAAASAPMVTKKLSRSAGTNDSPWVFTGLNNSIAYNMSGNDNSTVIIGSTTVPNSMDGNTRLYIDSGNNASHIAFGNGNTEPLLLTADPTRRRIGFSNQNIPTNSIFFGANQTLNANGYSDVVAIGDSTTIGGSNTIIIGSGANAINGNTAIAIGKTASTTGSRVIAIGDDTLSRTDSIAIGSRAKARFASGIAIGSAAEIDEECSSAIAIGYDANAKEYNAIAIGSTAYAKGSDAIALGDANVGNSTLRADRSIAIGYLAQASRGNSIAIGSNASTLMNNSVAIGAGARADQANQIVLGTKEDTVYIPGRLVVGGHVALGINSGASVNMRFNSNNSRWYGEIGCDNNSQAYKHKWNETSGAVSYSSSKIFSDRRLKNVGEKYAAGLNELKKLDFFHFTFKQDEEKTPHVGVMAQDLQKVFPDAVTKGDDGYLRIRWEDMFYAVINAVKELDNKIAEIVQNITDINSTIEKQNKTIEEQQKTIDELVKRIEKLEKQK